MTQQTARIIEPTSATWVLDNTTSVRVDGRRETVVIQHDGALDTDQARWLATTLDNAMAWLDRKIGQDQELDAELPF